MQKRWMGIARTVAILSMVGCSSAEDQAAEDQAAEPRAQAALEAVPTDSAEEASLGDVAAGYDPGSVAAAEPLDQPIAEAPTGGNRGAGLGAAHGTRRGARRHRGGPGALNGLGAVGGGGANRFAEAEADDDWQPPSPSRAPAARRMEQQRAARGRTRGPRPTTTASASPAAAIPQPALPQNAVLASTFVGGRGAQARLEDLLDRGVMVGGENVRLEAFDELGRLPYPVPAREAVGLHAQLERSRLVSNGERVHLQIALMARRGEAPARPRMDVRLVFDRSGSMMGDKWNHAIAAAHALVNRLEAGDTFGLISYSDDASLDLSPRRVGDRRAAHRAIDSLAPGGGTNIEAALRLAQQNAPRRREMNDVLLSVLVSDGVANIGQTNPQELGRLARQTFDASGALTTSVGLGTDFDESTMLAIAREGSGSYHFVRRSGDISDILTDELEERAQAVAQALRLRIELADGVVARRVYGSRVLDEQQAQAVRRTEIATDRRLAAELGITRDRQTDEDRGLRIHLPTFRRGDQHVVLMELEVPPGTNTSDIAHISLEYKDLIARRNRDAEVDVSAERTRDREAAVASTQRTVKRTVLAFQAGDALRGASSALSQGDVMRARQLLEERHRVLVAAADLWNDPSLREDANLLSRYDRVLGSAWNGWDSQSRRTMVMAMGFYGDRRMR